MLKSYVFFKYAACEGEITPIESAMREIPPFTNTCTFMYNFLLGQLILQEKEWENILKNRSSVGAVLCSR